MIDALRWLSLVAWLVPFVSFTPAMTRWTLGRGHRRDPLKSSVWFVALVIMGFNFRWILFPGATQHMVTLEMAIWSGLYVLSSLAGPSLMAGVYLDDAA